MARYEHLLIYKTAVDLTVYLEQVVRNFSRHRKHTLGVAPLHVLSRCAHVDLHDEASSAHQFLKREPDELFGRSAQDCGKPRGPLRTDDLAAFFDVAEMSQRWEDETPSFLAKAAWDSSSPRRIDSKRPPRLRDGPPLLPRTSGLGFFLETSTRCLCDLVIMFRHACLAANSSSEA